jgi:hypothetical protein
MIWLSLFAVPLAFLIARYWRDSDLDPILWKWFIRLIWLGSIVAFQALELQRYRQDLPYRPFFGLYAGVLFALAVWVAARLLANVTHRDPRRDSLIAPQRAQGE